MFASAPMSPKPQPGKFPVVFQTGAGEPSRDQQFTVDERVLSDVLTDLPSRFTHNAKYAEFKAHAELEDDQFNKELWIAALLRLSQQFVHSHVNMGLPQGDFAPVASTDVMVPQSISAYLMQYGEHSVPALGTRYLLSDYGSTVKSLVWAADWTRRNGGVTNALKRLWLPVYAGDKRTKAIVANRLLLLIEDFAVSVTAELLEEALFSGDVPPFWEVVKTVLGTSDEERDRFDFLFTRMGTEAQFVTRFTTVAATSALGELDLHWPHPQAAHVDWSFNVKELFTNLSDAWARRSATYALFFELSSSHSNRNAATGSQSQMASVTTSDAVTVLKTHLALSAPEFSLAACFPVTCVYTGGLKRKVVLTTPLSVKQRGTEFAQLDWR